MKVNKIFLLFIMGLISIIFIVISGCKKKGLIPKDEIKPTLIIDVDSIEIDKEGETFNIAITSNTSWVVESNKDWCTPSKKSGIDNDSISIVISKNTTTNKRFALISIKGEDTDTIFCYVKQDKGELFVTDIDGNIYPTVKIGEQIWMAENLKTTHYANGNSIQLVSDNYYWDNLGNNDYDKAYCWYNNDKASKDIYGALYTYAAATNGNSYGYDVQGVCPNGWHLPNNSEWSELISNLGGISVAGSKMAGYSNLWLNGNLVNSSDFGTSGFNAVPSGGRLATGGAFGSLHREAIWWSSTEAEYYGGSFYEIHYNNGGSSANSLKACGWTVRCIKN